MTYNCANWADLPWTDVRPGVRRKAVRDLFAQSAPSQLQADPVVGRKMAVLADAMGQIVEFLVVVEKGVVHRKRRQRQLVSGTHARHHEHPASGDGVIGIDVYRMRLHQRPEIPRPGRDAVEGSIFIHHREAERLQEILRREHIPVVILVRLPQTAPLLQRLRLLLRHQAGDLPGVSGHFELDHFSTISPFTRSGTAAVAAARTSRRTASGARASSGRLRSAIPSRSALPQPSG